MGLWAFSDRARYSRERTAIRGCWNRPQSEGHGGAERVGSSELGRAVLVEDVELGDLEAGATNQARDLAGQVAASEDPLLHRLEAMLPPPDPLVRRQAVLDESHRTARLEHAPNLRQCPLDVGDGAHRPGREGGVEAVVLERKRLSVEARSFDRNTRCAQARGG